MHFKRFMQSLWSIQRFLRRHKSKASLPLILHLLDMVVVCFSVIFLTFFYQSSASSSFNCFQRYNPFTQAYLAFGGICSIFHPTRKKKFSKSHTFKSDIFHPKCFTTSPSFLIYTSNACPSHLSIASHWCRSLGSSISNQKDHDYRASTLSRLIQITDWTRT